jgi:hypothetical protein
MILWPLLRVVVGLKDSDAERSSLSKTSSNCQFILPRKRKVPERLTK